MERIYRLMPEEPQYCWQENTRGFAWQEAIEDDGIEEIVNDKVTESKHP